MFANSWQLSCIFLVMTPLMAYIFRYTSRRLQMLSTNVQKAVGNVSHVAEETIEGYKVVRTFGGEQYEEEKFKKATEQNQKREMKIIVTDTVGSSSVQLLAAIPISISLYLATLPSLHISAGSFAAILGAMVSVLRPVRRMSKVNTMIQRGIAGARSLFELFDEPLENDHGQVKLKRAKGEICYQNVTFHYPSNAKRIILKDVNFTIHSGETVALVGHSGSGKTSLVNLLARFYDVQKGNILVDGLDIRQYRLRDLRNQFAFVSQHVSLFNDTIAQNISYGRFDKVDITEIEKVAKAAYAYDFIQQLPNGFHTLIGENGVLLSGGQRQRIAIARALLKDAPILILDEATSSLDTESERYIQAALEQLMQNRTTIVIAHRLSTIEKADRILLIENGCLLEQGTHLELLAMRGQYAKLHSMQFYSANELSAYEMT
jgi:subfamily B ATP-binding cassette protein MsbA